MLATLSARPRAQFYIASKGVKELMGAVADVTDVVQPMLEEAKKVGRKDEKVDIAKRLLEKNLNIEEIKEITGLSAKELESLQ